MKTLVNLISHFRSPQATQVTIVLAGFLLVLVSLEVRAQDYYKTSGSPNKGHWQLSTDYNSRGTTIRFYNPANQVVYQETLAGQYIKPTSRNLERIERTFDHFMKGNLILAQVKFTVLSEPQADYRLRASDRKKREEIPLKEISSANLIMRLDPLVEKPGFRLRFINPRQDRVRIRLRNQDGEIGYREVIPDAYH